MARRDRDYRTLVMDTLDGIRELFKTKNIPNDLEAHNELIESVNYLEDILSPYMNQSDATEYNPRQGKDEIENAHYRVRACLTICKHVGLLPPIQEDEYADDFVIPDMGEA